jgi:hypothetical protein
MWSTGKKYVITQSYVPEDPNIIAVTLWDRQLGLLYTVE